MLKRKFSRVRAAFLGHPKKGSSKKANYNLASARLVEMKKATESQIEKFLPTMSKTFERTISFIPKSAIDKLCSKRGMNLNQLKMEFFRNTVFLPPVWFDEIKTLLGEKSNVSALHFDGQFIMPSNGKYTKNATLFSLMHEMTHGFDRALGIKRSNASVEALAYAVQLFAFGEEISVAEASQYKTGETGGKEYDRGFKIGKEAAEVALKLKRVKGAQHAFSFMHNLFTMGEINRERISQLETELLK